MCVWLVIVPSHTQVPMIDDEDDFKESSKRGVAKRATHDTVTKKSKRSRRQVLKDSGEVTATTWWGWELWRASCLQIQRKKWLPP